MWATIATWRSHTARSPGSRASGEVRRVSALRTVQASTWPPELETFDPARWSSERAWHGRDVLQAAHLGSVLQLGDWAQQVDDVPGQDRVPLADLGRLDVSFVAGHSSSSTQGRTVRRTHLVAGGFGCTIRRHLGQEAAPCRF
jgi:hypothetical protein